MYKIWKYFEQGQVFLGTAGPFIGTKLAPPYACYRLETEFLEKGQLKPWISSSYIDDIFFV